MPVNKLTQLLRQLPWPPLLMAAILLGLAPFSPQPHLVEKLNMLLQGSLTKPLDIFDLLFHLTPTLVVLLKLLAGKEN